jgi:hypothetical protein
MSGGYLKNGGEVGTGGPALSTATPQPPGTAAAGSTGDASDAGHVHARELPDPTALPDGHVATVASGAWTAAAPAGGSTDAGTDAARPAASTGLVGSLYTATDTATRYLCESDGVGGARWCVVGRHHHEGRDTTCARAQATRSAESDTTMSAASVLSLAVVFAIGTLPADGRIILSCDGNVGGWHLRMGDTPGNFGRISSFRIGMGSAFAHLTGAVAAANNAKNCLALTWDGVTVRYSWNGAPVATASHTSGTMTNDTAPLRYCKINLGVYALNIDYGAVKLWSTAVGDADLEAVALAGSTTGRIPDAAGATCVYDWHAARYAEGIAVQPCVRGTAQRLTWSAAPPMVIR